MRLFPVYFYMIGVLLAAAGTAHSQAGPTTTREFTARVQELEEKGDWEAVRKIARDWQTAHPTDVEDAVLVELDALKRLGDIAGAYKLQQRFLGGAEFRPTLLDKLVPQTQDISTIRRDFPALHLQPLRYAPSEVVQAQTKWWEKGADLIEAQSYDEIEKTAQELQKSNEVSTTGWPYLESFFAGVCGGKEEDSTKRHTRIASWRAARPQSDLARLAAITFWTDAAWKARGGGVASTITPRMRAQMQAGLVEGAQTLKDLPESAFQSPWPSGLSSIGACCQEHRAKLSIPPSSRESSNFPTICPYTPPVPMASCRVGTESREKPKPSSRLKPTRLVVRTAISFMAVSFGISRNLWAAYPTISSLIMSAPNAV